MTNTIYTIKEYMAQGFTKEEAPMVMEHDTLYNKYVINEINEEEKERMFFLATVLGL